MSDFRAIGGVSATLQRLLTDRMDRPDGLSSVPVTIGPPPFSSKDNDPRKEDARVNVFLYRVTENGYLQNQEIPGQGASSGYGHPPLGLNLHYLVTAYGNAEVSANGSMVFDDTTAHFLLGSAMRVLHDVPVVTEHLTSIRPPSGMLVLHESLRDGYEQVRLSLEPLTLEDVTKVWTALALRYRLSAAYVVNVVQIESRRARTFPRPVGQPASPTVPPLPTDPPAPGPWIHALTIQTPTITDVRVRRVGETIDQPFPYARIGDTLVLRGTSLSGPVTMLAFGDLVVPATFASPERVEVVIPDATVPGSGAIPDAQRLQPGVRTVRVVTQDPLVAHGSFSSSDAVFMLVPSVDPMSVIVATGPPRTLTIGGARLVGPASGGETIIGRSAVPRGAYLSETPTTVVVPLPTTLPTRGVQVIVGGPLPDPVPIGTATHTLDIDIDGTVQTVTAILPSMLPRQSVAAIVAGLIHDADPSDARFAGARVDLWQDRLIIVPGDLTSPIKITSPGALTFATDLGLTVTQPPGAGTAAVSGVLPSPPPLSSPVKRLQVRVGAQPPVTVTVASATSLETLAVDLQSKISAASASPAYANARVVLSGTQLVLIPGTADAVTFDAAPGDDSTVVELQLHARFAVRVRVNGAESIDPAVVELPQ